VSGGRRLAPGLVTYREGTHQISNRSLTFTRNVSVGEDVLTHFTGTEYDFRVVSLRSLATRDVLGRARSGAMGRRGKIPIVVHPHGDDTVYVVPLEPTTRHLSRRRARGMAQREWRRRLEATRAWAAQEAELLHHPARRDGHRPAHGTRPILGNDDRSALDRAGGR
jgi:hypothetical protein